MTMTRTTACAAAVVLTSGLLIATAAEAGAVRKTYIQVTEVRTGQTDTFAGGPPKAGDSFSYTSTLRQKDQQVGTGRGSCVVKKITGPAGNPRTARTRCAFLLDFTTGTIRLGGKVVFDFAAGAADFVVPIVRGTGRFEGVSGAMKHHTVSATEGQLTLLLTRSGRAT